MTITLPDELRTDAERQAREAGFATVDEYVAYLVASDREDDAVEPPDPAGGVRTADHLRAAIQAGRQSPPVASVEAFFEEVRLIATGKRP